MNEMEFKEELDLLIRSRYPVIWIDTWEEERAIEIVKSFARPTQKPVYLWDSLDNMRVGDRQIEDTRTPEAALRHIQQISDNGIFILRDLHPYLKEEHPSVIRRLRHTANALRKSYKTIVIISPLLRIPIELEKVITVLDLPLPDELVIKQLLMKVLDKVKNHPEIDVDTNEALVEQICRAARGLTLAEAERLFLKAAVSDKRFGPEDLGLILQEKQQVLRKTGVLEYFETSENLTNVGGLNRLKNWLAKRQRAFDTEARSFGLPEPKGLLLLGVQGCGKSLMAKAVASMWQLPLLRLDVGSLFSSYIGSTEANMRKAIQTAETLAPVVLWLDEIEKDMAGLESSGSVDAGVTARVFSSFLLWMQEKKAPVFVVATANNVQNLPPELLRKGRFDEIFFVDLPEVEERKEILDIHLRKKHRDPANYDTTALAKITEGFSGAELEQVIVAALYDAFAEHSQLEQEHLLQATRDTIPLSTTMAERINALREWAAQRAVPAS